MTFRARQRKLKRKIRNEEWSRLMGNHRSVGIEEAWSLDVYAAKYIAPRLKLLRKITHGYPGELNLQYPEGNDAFECWQYTNEAHIDGISGNVDLDIYLKKK